MKKELLKLLAAITAMCMLASFAGCSDDEDDDEDSKKSKSSVSDQEDDDDDDDDDADDEKEEETTKKKGGKKSTTAPEEEEDTTEAKTAATKSADLYDYYSELDDAYNNNDVTKFVELDYNSAVWNGKGYVCRTNKDYDYEVYTFDASGNGKSIWSESTAGVDEDFYVEDIYFCAGNIYVVYEKYDDSILIKKYDSDGKEAGSITYSVKDAPEDIGVITANGEIVLADYWNEDFEQPYVISSDLKTITKIDQADKPLQHGLSEKITDYSNFLPVSYKSKVYLGDYGLYLDCSTGKWTECDLIDDDHTSFYMYGNIGQYLFNYYDVYDITTDQFIDDIPSFAYENYYGGAHHICHDYDSNKWCEYKVPSDAWYISDDDYLVKELGKETTYIYDLVYLDDTCYGVVDDYGIFIRTYENGNDESKEITAMLF